MLHHVHHLISNWFCLQFAAGQVVCGGILQLLLSCQTSTMELAHQKTIIWIISVMVLEGDDKQCWSDLEVDKKLVILCLSLAGLLKCEWQHYMNLALKICCCLERRQEVNLNLFQMKDAGKIERAWLIEFRVKTQIVYIWTHKLNQTSQLVHSSITRQTDN